MDRRLDALGHTRLHPSEDGHHNVEKGVEVLHIDILCDGEGRRGATELVPQTRGAFLEAFVKRRFSSEK